MVSGTMAAWRKRDPTPRLALTRFCSVFLVIQVPHCVKTSTTWLSPPRRSILAGPSIDVRTVRSAHQPSTQRMGHLLHSLGNGTTHLKTDALLEISRGRRSRSSSPSSIWERRPATRATMDYEAAGALDMLPRHPLRARGPAS